MTSAWARPRGEGPSRSTSSISLSGRGFFYLERPTALLERHGLEARFEHYEVAYQHALLGHPHLKDLMHAPTVFQTGYNATWSSESTVVRQAIEAFMA